MPLLGKKTFTLGTQSLNSGAEDAPYLIPHTKERFQSKTEFEKRKDLYSQNIWTCRATGHTNLTHEEACKSEKVVFDQLKSQFPKCYEKSVLEIVHHSTSSLDSLVDQVWWKLHQELIPGEKVNLKVTIANKLIPAKIVSVDRSGTEAKDATSNCNSPSSDKENTSEEKEKSPKKWVPPKMLPYTYSIELENEAKVVHSVPGSDLIRQEKAPAKDLLRLFIRVSALRSWTASNSPWVVNSDLVSEYKLISKFADFFLSPAKMAEVSKRAEENGKKRKLSNGTPHSSSCKKLKLEKSSEKSIKKKKAKSGNKTKKKDKKDSKDVKGSQKKKGTPSKNSSSPKKNAAKDVLVVSDSDSDDNMTLAKLKRNSSVLTVDSDSDTPLYQLAGQSTPKKKVKKKADKDADEDIPLSKILSGSKKLGSLKKSGEKMKKKNEKTPVKKKKGKEDKKEGKKSPSKKASMKQVTLFDLTKKGKALLQQTPQKKSPQKVAKASPPKPPPTPAIVRRLLTARRETLHDKTKYSMLLKKAVNTLLPSQVKNLPEKLREEYERRKKLMDEKAKIEKMTPEQREEYLKEKREAARRRQKQRVLEKLRDQRKRFEDNDLELTPLPEAKLVSTPDGFPNELFGEVAMVTEFINCYGGLLMPESEYPIFTDALMKALVGGSSGFTYLSRVLNVLLQTLLQDQIAKGYTELRTKISDIAVSAYTSSELVRLCLQCGEEEEEDEDVPEEYISLLKDSEFYQLELEQKLCLLRGLCSRVLSTYSVQDYMDDQQRKAFQLTKQKNVELKEIAAQKKSNKQSAVMNKSLNDSKASRKTAEEEKKEESKDGSLSIASFYGKEAEVKGDEEEKNWGIIVKRRREAASQAAAEKERKERERAALAEKEYQKEREKERLRRKQEQIGEAILLARMVLRQDPIGTDRHHDRYWVFTNTTPGLYVEKGWMGQEVNYCVQSLQEKNATDEESSDDSSEEEEQEPKAGVNQTGTTPLKVVYRTKKHFIEKSVPHAGQNLWLTYRSLKDLDGLIKALHPQGIRESVLRNEIKKRYDDICRAINQATRTNLELRDSDGDVEMVAGFKKELSDMELRLRNGGLGGVPDYEEWEARLMEATEISVMGECLLEVKAGILDKFFQGFMKPVTKAESEETQVGEPSEDGVKKEEDKESEEDKPPEKEDKHERAVREWQESIESCQTMSRLHVLMAMLDSCVKWEKSAENAKCKICRKKCDDDRLLLCDECNQAFHMYCLRPALNKLPSGDWFCPACKPRRPQVRPLESESEEEEEDKETACRECGGEEKLMVCSKCPAAFHTQCHQPPLRHPPRGVWECSDCKNGISGRRKGRFARKAAPKRNYRRQVVSDDDEEEEESEEEEEEEQQKTRSRSSRSRGQKDNVSSARKTPLSGRSSRSRNHSAQESSAVTPTGRSSRRGPSELSLCEELLVRVMKHKSSWPFLEPVDKKLVPDYHSLIKKPMDFQTMQKKCARLSYASPQEFIEDAALVFENAEAYNKPDSDVFMCMREVEKVFKDLLQKQLPDWPYYRTVIDKEETSSGSENGRKRSRSKY